MVEANSGNSGLEVYMIPMMGDMMNLCFYITRDLQNSPGIVIDPAEPQKLIDFMTASGVQVAPNIILTTHKHYDHSMGNAEMRRLYPGIHVIGGAEDN